MSEKILIPPPIMGPRPTRETRDLLAGFALMATLFPDRQGYNARPRPEDAAKLAVLYADALLAELYRSE